ncbi:uncharacterized protein LOC131042450 [Cryptomeria japonica]|uniref:uncharacterized protein LOC131042450 n=1 Tax=Cryptomeria japonica TaxID=3369 RepID=UPI0025AB828C|nr:uncharacterized protein LOC131042450 [Cryptomeria japonica]
MQIETAFGCFKRENGGRGKLEGAPTGKWSRGSFLFLLLEALEIFFPPQHQGAPLPLPVPPQVSSRQGVEKLCDLGRVGKLGHGSGGIVYKVLHSKSSTCYALNVARQVLEGLKRLHTERIVHRDIKPANLLIRKNSQRIKIADFGVRRILSHNIDPCCNSYVGTCAYMSPERFDPQSYGGRYNGYAGDIWSLGLTLLECYVGHFPFVAAGEQADWPARIFFRFTNIDQFPSSAPRDHGAPDKPPGSMFDSAESLADGHIGRGHLPWKERHRHCVSAQTFRWRCSCLEKKLRRLGEIAAPFFCKPSLCPVR